MHRDAPRRPTSSPTAGALSSRPSQRSSRAACSSKGVGPSPRYAGCKASPSTHLSMDIPCRGRLVLAQSSGRKRLAKVALNHARPISRRLILTTLNSRHQTNSSGLTVVSRRDFLSNFRGITSRALDAFTAKDWEGASRLRLATAPA